MFGGDPIQVTCNARYTGGGQWTCAENNDAYTFTGNPCVPIDCTIDDDCSGEATAVEGDIVAGCTCTCKANRDLADCSTELRACNITADCSGPTHSTGVVGYDGSCTCACNDLWTGDSCADQADQDTNPCVQQGFNCVNNGHIDPDGAPEAGGVLPGTCACSRCDRGYTDGEGTCSDPAYTTKAECDIAGTWTPTPGYTCSTPNENCTLSTDVGDISNQSNAENGVYYCANGSTIQTNSPYSQGRVCGCNCGPDDILKFQCENSPLETNDLAGSCNAVTGCSYDGSLLTCQPNGQAFSECVEHNTSTTCGEHSECLWDSAMNQCTVSDGARSTCLSKSDNECLGQGSKCTLRGVCNVVNDSTRTGFGGAHCTIAQNAILAASAGDEMADKGIIWCNGHGVASGKTGSASCVCHPGWTGDKCQTVAGANDFGCPTQDGNCNEEQSACCARPIVDYCTGTGGNEVSACTRANEVRLGIGESRQQRCESQQYFENAATVNCVYHDIDPIDNQWHFFDRDLDSSDRLNPVCTCDCARMKSADLSKGELIGSDQQYQLSENGMKCIANCSQISPGDTICNGLVGDALEKCKQNNSPCYGRGSCNPATNKCNDRCLAGYTGDYCQHDTTGYESNDCGDYGQGAAPDDGSQLGYKCVCLGDWSSDGTDVNADGVAKCNVDPCHEGVTREVQRQSYPYGADGIGLISIKLPVKQDSPHVIKGMAIKSVPALTAAEVIDLPDGDTLTVVSVAPANSTAVTTAFETSTDDLSLQRFRLEGVHVANTSNYDKIEPSNPTSLTVDKELSFYHLKQGTIKCEIFDKSEGSRGECRSSSDGKTRSCNCELGFKPNSATRRCELCPFGTWGPGCNYRMDGTGAIDPETGQSMNLCVKSSLSDTVIKALMLSDAAHGRPDRTFGKCSDENYILQTECEAASSEDAIKTWTDGISTVADFRAKLLPPAGKATCEVVDTGGGSFDIRYNCDGEEDDPPVMIEGPNNDGTVINSKWLKGVNQNYDIGTVCVDADSEHCRALQCNRTPCGATDATPDSWHASIDTLNKVTGCVKNTLGGAVGTNYRCASIDKYDSGDSGGRGDYPGANATQMTWQAPVQNEDGKCRSVRYCDDMGILDQKTCTNSAGASPTATDPLKIRHQGGWGPFHGTFWTCLYDTVDAPGCCTSKSCR